MICLHIAGTVASAPKFCPESTASVLYLRRFFGDSSHSDYKIVSSLDTSYLDCLKYSFPFLRDAEVVVEGYANIVKHLKKRYPVNDFDTQLVGGAAQDSELLLASCTSFLLEKVVLIVYYGYYVNRTNYGKYLVTRVRQSYNFPLQYYLPGAFKASVEERCADLGLTDAVSSAQYQKDDEIRQKIASIQDELKLPPMSSVHSELQKDKYESLQRLRETSSNFRALNLMSGFLDTLAVATAKGRESSATMLLYGIVAVASNDEVPDKFLSSFLELRYGALVAAARAQLQSACSESHESHGE